MFWAQQIQHSLNWIECYGWNFNKYRIPIGHASVPKAWMFKGSQGSAFVEFDGNDTSIMVDEVSEIKRVAAIVPQSADDVDGVEVRR